MSDPITPTLAQIPLSTDERRRLESYTPTTLDTAVWQAQREAMWRAVAAAVPTGQEDSRKLIIAFALYLRFVEADASDDIGDLLTSNGIDAFVGHLKTAGKAKTTAQNQGGRLQRLRRALAGEPSAPYALPRCCQWDLGVLREVLRKGEKQILRIEAHHLYYFSKTLSEKLDYTVETAPELDDAARDFRRAALTAFGDALIDATLFPTDGKIRAIDSTGIWACARGKKLPKHLADKDGRDKDRDKDLDETLGEEAIISAVEKETVGNDLAVEKETVAKHLPHDLDARWGVKTRKDGKWQAYFGYELHTTVRVPDGTDGGPVLVERFILTPANTDIVDPTLGLLDRAIAAGYVIKEIIVDRHYSYKDQGRWADELRRRRIDQHLDLHPNDQGFRDYNGAKLAAGWLHCPGTPDSLGVIPRPGPMASQAEKDAFRAAIKERQAYAMRRVERPNLKGRARQECPALNGTAGCLLREGTVAVATENGLPIIISPPDRATAPACCTQRTVSTGADAQLKLSQPHYWGSEKWERSYALRTYVEGWYGSLKDPSTENVRRGFFRVTGLGAVTVLIALGIAACNVRQLRRWHERTGLGDPTHPLLRPAEPDHGFIELTAEQAAALDAARRRRMNTAGPTNRSGLRCRAGAR
jgi:hypothetical protein